MGRAAWLQDRRMQKFLDVLSWWERGELSMMQAGEMLGVSERQFRRYRDQYEECGLDGLVDRRLGRASPARVPKAELERMLGLYRGLYRGWNAKHFHEHLVREHGFAWGGAGQGPRQAKLGGVASGGYTWTKTQLHAAGLLSRAPRRGAHRRKRERKPCEGMMLHQDASREVFTTKGLPSSLYTDRGSHYFVTPKAGGAVDRLHLTQVGRALERLGIEHIAAYSPEARGRSERMFGTLQDRLIKELAKAGIIGIEAANAWIKETYLPAHNARFARPPALPETGFVQVHDQAQLVEALSRQEERVVGRDNTVGFDGMRLQLPESPLRHHWVKARVRVHAYRTARSPSSTGRAASPATRQEARRSQTSPRSAPRRPPA